MHNDYLDPDKHGVTSNDHEDEDHPASSDHTVSHARALYATVPLSVFIAITAQPRFTDSYVSANTESLAVTRLLSEGYTLHTVTSLQAILEKKLP